MNVLDLFSGIGGLSLAAEQAGMTVVAHVEIDPFCRRVLARHWPAVRCYEDVRDITAARLREDGIGPIDLICGGPPCQDISRAGNQQERRGLDGPRSGLWAEMARLVGALRPRYVVVENVADLLVRGMGRVLGDLAACGYDTEWQCLSAAAVGAPQERERIFVIAYPGGERVERLWAEPLSRQPIFSRWEGVRSPAEFHRRPDLPPPFVCRGDDGFPGRMDRLRALGNACIPAQAAPVFTAIMQAEQRLQEALRMQAEQEGGR